ncbi:hypothetical protein DVH05_016873 [Phytophthora capsici]|nr:hypothetical protein DVH05_016873 [Phytophthora capsici]
MLSYRLLAALSVASAVFDKVNARVESVQTYGTVADVDADDDWTGRVGGAADDDNDDDIAGGTGVH